MENKMMSFKETKDGELEILHFFNGSSLDTIMTKIGLFPTEIELESGDTYQGYLSIKSIQIDEEEKTIRVLFENRLIEIEIVFTEEESNSKFRYKNKK